MNRNRDFWSRTVAGLPDEAISDLSLEEAERRLQDVAGAEAFDDNKVDRIVHRAMWSARKPSRRRSYVAALLLGAALLASAGVTTYVMWPAGVRSSDLRITRLVATMENPLETVSTRSSAISAVAMQAANAFKELRRLSGSTDALAREAERGLAQLKSVLAVPVDPGTVDLTETDSDLIKTIRSDDATASERKRALRVLVDRGRFAVWRLHELEPEHATLQNAVDGAFKWLEAWDRAAERASPRSDEGRE